MRRSAVSNKIINRTIIVKSLLKEIHYCYAFLCQLFVFVSPVEKKEKRTVKPRELTPFDGMEVTT